MLQEHVKKLEESYKHNLKATEDFRYKYCLASEQVKRLRSCPKYSRTSKRQEDEKEPKVASDCAKPKQELSKLTSTPPKDCTICDSSKCTNTLLRSKTLEQFKKDYYEMIQNIVEKILEQKNVTPKEKQTEYNVSATVEELQYEMTRLKEANEKLQEQLDFHAYQGFPSIKDIILETYHKKKTEPQNTVTKLHDLVPHIFNEESEDVEISNASITFEDAPQVISPPSEDAQLAQGNISSAETNENYTCAFGSSTDNGVYREDIVENDENQKLSTNNNSMSNNIIVENVGNTSISSYAQKSQNGSRSCTKPKCVGKMGICGCTRDTTNSSITDSSEGKKQRSSTVYEKQNNIGKKSSMSETNTVSTNTETVTYNDICEKLGIGEKTVKNNCCRKSSASAEKRMTNGSSKKSTSNNGCAISKGSGLYKTEMWMDEEQINYGQMKTKEAVTDEYNQTKIATVCSDFFKENTSFDKAQETILLPAQTEIIAEMEINQSLEPMISTRSASISKVSHESLVDSSFLASNEKSAMKAVKIDFSNVANQSEEVKNFEVRAETHICDELTFSMLASTLTEIKSKIVELVDKQDSACKEMELVKNQIVIAQDITKPCRVQISKLTESVEGQKEIFLAKFQENKIITDALKQTNDKIKMELDELKNKIDILFINVEALKENQKMVNSTKDSRRISGSDDIVTVEECKHEILKKGNHGMELSTSKQSQDTTFVVTETLDLGKENISSKVSECSILQEHLSDLQREKIQKDKQITCLNELICCYSKINNDVSTHSDMATKEMENHLKKFKYCNDEFQDYIEKIKEENHKLKTTISCVIHHLQEKMKELHLEFSGENIGIVGNSTTNVWSICNSDSSSTCLNHQSPQDHPEIQIEDIYNAVLRSVTPIKKYEETPTYPCKSVKSITCCHNVNIEHFVEGRKTGQEVNIEDVYKAVLCSCNSRDKNAQQKLTTNVNKIKSNKSVGTSINSKDDCPSKTSCSCLGYCFMDLEPNLSDEKSIITNLQTYVQYLHEQLQVITNIENQIADLHVDIKNQQS